ncbi:MAG TPA: DUF4126 domain-containing protein [Usitatibacter sp.]|nr:DUF4126 domain-containing protein [Usitatibacter sp.]
MNAQETALLISQLAMGFALAATVGLRTFLPLLAAGLLARFGYVNLGESFEWMSRTAALVVFGSAVIFEVLADKVPGLDHALHLVETFVKPVAGTLVAASLFTNLDPMMAVVLGLVGGGTIAGAVHVAKGTTRAASTALTGGLGNPILSILDDVLAVGGIILAILAPIVAALIVVVLIVGGMRLLLKRRRTLATSEPR